MNKLANSIIRGAEEALSYARGYKGSCKVHKVKIPSEVNVKSIRYKLHMTREEFAANFGFSRRTLEKWEQGVRKPEGATRAYLTVIARNPKAVASALSRCYTPRGHVLRF